MALFFSWRIIFADDRVTPIENQSFDIVNALIGNYMLTNTAFAMSTVNTGAAHRHDQSFCHKRTQ